MRIKKDDEVMVIKGRDRGKRGTVQQADPDHQRVLVDGVQIVKRHLKAQGMRAAEIIEKESFVPVSNVALICPHCQSPARVIKSTLGDGSKGRSCKRCKEVIE